MSVAAFENPQTGVGRVLVDLRSRHADVTYSAPAAVSSGSVQADLGELGGIDVHFVPAGRTRTEQPECGKPVQVDAGRYEGSIDFEGERGYSEVHASSARGEAGMVLSLVCASTGSEGIGGHAPGARLTVRRRRTPSRFELTAMENGPTRPVRLGAGIDERRGGLAISRSVEVVAGPGAFDFDVPAGTATLQPPEPFAGSAAYRHLSRGRSTWRGDLSVDFPGRPDVRLAGRGTRAGLIRAVLNPGHPF